MADDITRAQMREAQLLAATVPADIRARLSDAELAARCSEAARLSVAAQTAQDPVLKQAYDRLAKATVAALPAAEVQARHRELQQEADQLGPGKQRDAIMRQIDNLLAANPVDYPVRRPEVQARDIHGPVDGGGTTGLGKPRTGSPQRSLPGDYPGRVVVKAAKAGGDSEDSGPQWPDEPLIIVHDAAGNVAGAVPQSKLLQVVDVADVLAGMQGSGGDGAAAGPKAQRQAKR